MKTNQNFLKPASLFISLSAVETCAPALVNTFKWPIKRILAKNRRTTIQKDKSRILLEDIFYAKQL